MIRKYNKRENCGNINIYVKPNCHNSVERRPNIAHAVVVVVVVQLTMLLILIIECVRVCES